MRGQFTTYWQIPDKKNNYNYVRTKKGNLLPFGRFQPKKIITIMWKDNLLPIDRFQTKKNNYNYVRGQFTIYWQIPDKKIITIMWEGNLLPFDWFQTKKDNYNYVSGQLTRAKKNLQLRERAIYYLLIDSRQKK